MISLDFVFGENSGRKSRDYCDVIVLEMRLFQMFSLHTSPRFQFVWSVFENLRDGLVWIVGQAIVITKQNKGSVKAVQVVKLNTG